jgi:hypothetical protein
VTGRFLSEDPLGYFGGGTNFYAYAGNDPIYFRDPYGLSFSSCFVKGLGTGALTTAGVVIGATIIVAAAPEAAAVVTGVMFYGGIAGLLSSGGSVMLNPSANNIGYNLGSLTGSSIVGGVNGFEMSRTLSPAENQPSFVPSLFAPEQNNAWLNPQGEPSISSLIGDSLFGNPSGGPNQTRDHRQSIDFDDRKFIFARSDSLFMRKITDLLNSELLNIQTMLHT